MMIKNDKNGEPLKEYQIDWMAIIVFTGYLQSLDSYFTHNEDRDNKTFGDVQVQWTTQGREKALLKQYNIVWYSHDDRVVQTKYVSTDYDKCSIPVTRLK